MVKLLEGHEISCNASLEGNGEISTGNLGLLQPTTLLAHLIVPNSWLNIEKICVVHRPKKARYLFSL